MPWTKAARIQYQRSGLISNRHRLFLQFRHGRLAGWKEDYGENWMWE